MLARFVLFLLIATVRAKIQNGNLPDNLKAIVGGDEATPHSRPWMGQLLRNGRFNCGCSLISNLYALTAAHCVEDGHRLYSATRVGVRRIISHPKYNRFSFHYDAALLVLSEAVSETDKISIIPLAGKSPETNDACIIAGWGSTKYYGSRPSNVLKEATVYIEPPETCDGFFHGEKTVLCISGFYRSSSCDGDSGGPMMCSSNNAYQQQHGISSFLNGRCKIGRGGYTDVPKLLPWIRDYVDRYTQEDIEVLLSSIGTNWTTKDEKTLLHLAGENGFYETAEQIINEDSQLINAIDKKHQFPIHVAAKTGHCGIVSLLLKNGADVNSTARYFDDPEESPSVSVLQLAAYGGFVECVQTLLNSKIDINHRDNTISTALHWAAEANKYEVVKMLVKAGADVSALNIVEKTAFDMATDQRIKTYLKQKDRRENLV